MQSQPHHTTFCQNKNHDFISLKENHIPHLNVERFWIKNYRLTKNPYFASDARTTRCKKRIHFRRKTLGFEPRGHELSGNVKQLGEEHKKIQQTKQETFCVMRHDRQRSRILFGGASLNFCLKRPLVFFNAKFWTKNKTFSRSGRRSLYSGRAGQFFNLKFFCSNCQFFSQNVRRCDQESGASPPKASRSTTGWSRDRQTTRREVEATKEAHEHKANGYQLKRQ